MPCSSAALITSSSRIEPPGWITAVAPASIATSKPSANGKNASDATTKPLVIAPARSLRDRLIVIDGDTAWVVGQSFKDLAKRAHTSLVRMDPESGTLKISAHIAMWQT